MDLSAAYSAHGRAEVTFAAQVTTPPDYFCSLRTHRQHESFGAQTCAGPIKIVDNVGIAPPVPVVPGDRVEVRGEIVHDPGQMPIVHWTHHDPSGRHSPGFIRLHDRLYA